MADRIIRLRKDDANYEVDVIVKDKYPEWDDIDLEGKYIVEVSVELFLQMTEAQGFRPVPIPGGSE